VADEICTILHHRAPRCTILHQPGEIIMAASKLPYPKICAYCQKVFEARKSTTRFCSHKCASRAYKDNARQLKVLDSSEQTRMEQSSALMQIQAREVLTVEQLSLLLGVSRWTVNRFLKAGLIRSIKVMGRRLILRKEVEQFLKGRHQ